MSYTKRNLNCITLLLMIGIFICLYIINSQIFLLSSSYYHDKSNQVYSKIIPIQEHSKEIKSIDATIRMADSFMKPKEQEIESTSILQQEMEQVEKQTRKNNKTQRVVIKENKDNPWRIEIPRLKLDVHIQESTSSNVLLKAVGHFEESSNWNGNVCLAAHNRGYNCNFFQKIKNLKIGDEIIYHTTHGKRIYQVQTNKIILETDWSYLEETKDNRITLITCEENRREYRRCVQAVQVAEKL